MKQWALATRNINVLFVAVVCWSSIDLEIEHVPGIVIKITLHLEELHS